MEAVISEVNVGKICCSEGIIRSNMYVLSICQINSIKSVSTVIFRKDGIYIFCYIHNALYLNNRATRLL